jgi:hypothetical protein
MAVATRVIRRVSQILAADSGLPFTVAELAAVELAGGSYPKALAVVDQNVLPETLERKTGATYPAVHVYCERMENRLREKFRTFSGVMTMVAEVRVSQDRVDELDRSLQFYVDSVIQVLNYNRGDWGSGLFFSGAYEVEFGAIRHGGKNYLQSAKIRFVVDASAD